MSRWLRFYVWTLATAGFLALGWSVWKLWPGPPDWFGLALFTVIVALAEMTGTELLPGSRATISVSSAIYFASLLIFGPFGGTITAASSGLAATALTAIRARGSAEKGKTPLLQRALFNMSTFAISSLLAGLVYTATGGTVGEISGVANLWPILLASVTLDFVNAALVVGVVSLQTGQRPFQVWNQNFRWAAPINILTMAIGGAALALGYTRLGLLGVAVFLLPVLATSYSFRLYVERTKAQMVHLEEIIAERTAELRAANEELKRLDQQKTSFFSIINHEMRTPLTSILGYADLLLLGSELSEKQRNIVGIIQESGQRLLGLVNNLLDISRIEAGCMTVSPEPVALRSIVEDALGMIRPLADQKHIVLHVDIPSDLPLVHADPRKTSQVLINLLSNAVKYTSPAGLITVRSYLSEDRATVCTDVADTGIGIPPEELPHIFDRFSRVESKRLSGTIGTGLGLAISKGLVEAHGGQIWAESEEGKGSCFHFTLPVYKEKGQPFWAGPGR